jgi:predicted Zn-dependent peptidase
MMNAFCVASRAVSLAVLLSTAAPVLAARPVPVSQLVKQVRIPYQQFTLENGLRVIVHTDRKAPIVAVSVWYGVGSKHEPKGKTGFAHLFEHLMFNGSENAPGGFFEPLQQVGATDFNGTTWFDRTNYFQNVPTGALDLALFLESDRMGHLLGAVTQEKLDNQRGVVQNEKRQGDNQPYGLVEYEMLGTLFPEGHPYHHSTIGSMADLDAATLDDVRNWFKAKYGPNNAVLVLAGDIDLATAKARVQHWFGDIPRGPDVPKVNAPVPSLPAPVAREMKDRVATTRIMRLWAVPGLKHKDAVALEAAAGVLGGLSSSRLENALVRAEQLAVGVTASASIFEDVGIFSVSADVKPGTDAAQVASRLDALIADFLKTGPNADELARFATRTLSSRIGGLESVGGFGGKAVLLAEGALYTGDPAQYRRDLADLAKLDPAKVRSAARTWLGRPVFALNVVPGERDAYVEAGGSEGKALSGPARYLDDGEAPAPARTAVDRSKFPEVGALTPLDFPDIERTRLGNGIEVFFARRDAVPKVLVNVSFDAGHAADPREALGTHSLMLSLMDEGTRTRTSVQIAEESERLGASISTSASLDRTSFSMSALSANLAPSLSLLSDIVRNPAFENAEVERVRSQQLARIAAELTQPQGLAARILPVKLYGAQHPYGVPGTGTGDASVVRSLTRVDLAAFHRRWIRPDTARIFVVGNTRLEDIKPMLEVSFGNWPQDRMARPQKDFSRPVPPPQPRIYLIDRPNSPQSVILAGHVLDVSGRDDLVTLRAANEILGGSFLSRLNMDLRETKGWAYGVRSGISNNENQIAFTFQAPVQADRTGDSIRAFQAQLGDFLGAKGVTSAELTRTVNGNVRELPGSFETSGDVMGGLSTIINLGRPDDYYETLARKYQALTTADVDAAGRARIDPKRMIYVVVGDAKKVRPQLDGIGLPVEEMPTPSTQ